MKNRLSFDTGGLSVRMGPHANATDVSLHGTEAMTLRQFEKTKKRAEFFTLEFTAHTRDSDDDDDSTQTVCIFLDAIDLEKLRKLEAE